MRHFHDLYAMKHCHMANGHPDEKYQNSPTGGKRSPTGGGAKAPLCPPCSATPA